MQKKSFFIILLLTSHISYAETCPSVSDLKAGILKEWQAYDLDNGEPLSEDDLAIFKKSVDTFAYTIWLPDAPEGSGQCHYHQHDDEIEAYLAKPTLEPDKSIGNWRIVNYDMTLCDSSIDDCRYLDP